MKPVGLTNPHNPEKPYAVVQLRQDNISGTLFNMVGFQTKLKHGAQAEIFRKIPGLERAEFARLGGIHRNTFINGPHLLDSQLRLKSRPAIRFAGQVAGVEGYVESAGLGLVAGFLAAAERLGRPASPPPITTALGSLVAHVTGHSAGQEERPSDFQPMNINFGILPPLTGRAPKGRRGRIERRKMMTERAKVDLQTWLAGTDAAAAE
jgi:methylenetetrahydrofolate--tRNA-(uracil-5-)-methyltransferase